MFNTIKHLYLFLAIALPCCVVPSAWGMTLNTRVQKPNLFRSQPPPLDPEHEEYYQELYVILKPGVIPSASTIMKVLEYHFRQELHKPPQRHTIKACVEKLKALGTTNILRALTRYNNWAEDLQERESMAFSNEVIKQLEKGTLDLVPAFIKLLMKTQE